jgi:TonB family protein
MRRHINILAATLLICCSLQAQSVPERPVDVPDINGMAVTLVKPAFPETAMDVGADGESVVVKVVVDEHGNVVSASCSLSCHAMLKDAAETAALQSKFKPLIRNGAAIRYQGTLLFTYVVKRVDWFRFATAIESTRQFDNISLGPVAQILSADHAKEKASLLSLDEKGVDLETRWKVIAEVLASIKTQLKGMDAWRFDLGLALRRVTFWPQAAEAINRPELQKAIDDLGAVIARVPEGVSEPLIKELTVMSKYRIPAEIPERELRKEISEMYMNVGKLLR